MNISRPVRRRGHMYPIYDWGRFSLVIDNQFGYKPIKVALIHRAQKGKFTLIKRREINVPRRRTTKKWWANR